MKLKQENISSVVSIMEIYRSLGVCLRESHRWFITTWYNQIIPGFVAKTRGYFL